MSGRGLVHLEALALYDQSLLDATLREPPEGFRYPSANEVMKADKAAWAEVSRLVRSKEASVEAAFAHVAKPGGLLWGIIRPVDKKTSGYFLSYCVVLRAWGACSVCVQGQVRGRTNTRQELISFALLIHFIQVDSKLSVP